MAPFIASLIQIHCPWYLALFYCRFPSCLQSFLFLLLGYILSGWNTKNYHLHLKCKLINRVKALDHNYNIPCLFWTWKDTLFITEILTPVFCEQSLRQQFGWIGDQHKGGRWPSCFVGRRCHKIIIIIETACYSH